MSDEAANWAAIAILGSVLVVAAPLTAQAQPTQDDAAAHAPEADVEPERPADALPPAWNFQVDPLTTFIGYVHLQIERRLAPHWSLYAGPHARLFTAPWDDKEDFVGFGVEVGVRYFFQPTAPQGWWLGVRGVLARLRAGDSRAPGGYVSALAGYTAIFARRFVLAGGLGVQYLHYRIEGLGPKQFFVAAHTTLGVAF